MKPLLCTIHPHSTERRAIKCRAEMAGYRADKAIERSGALSRKNNVRMVKYSPPRVFTKNGIEVVVFYEDDNMKMG